MSQDILQHGRFVKDFHIAPTYHHKKCMFHNKPLVNTIQVFLISSVGSNWKQKMSKTNITDLIYNLYNNMRVLIGLVIFCLSYNNNNRSQPKVPPGFRFLRRSFKNTRYYTSCRKTICMVTTNILWRNQTELKGRRGGNRQLNGDKSAWGRSVFLNHNKQQRFI